MIDQRPYVGVRGRGNTAPDSRLEHSARDRSARARAHLERVRGGRPATPVPSLSLIAPIAVAASLLLGVFFGSPLLAATRSWIAGEPIRLESISVSGADRLSLAEVGRATALPKGVLMAEIEPSEVESHLVTHPWISHAAVVRLPSSQLLVGITERIARAVVSFSVDGERQGLEPEWRVVSSTGLAFASASGSDIDSLPRLVARSVPTSAQPNEALANAIEFTTRFPAFDLPIPTEVVVDEGVGSEGWIVRLPSLAPRVVLGRDNLDERLAALATLVASGRQELAEAETIDLRFAEQAVLRSTSSSKGTAQAVSRHGSVSMPKPRPTGRPAVRADV
jgi:cell division septal protein FtsQ